MKSNINVTNAFSEVSNCSVASDCIVVAIARYKKLFKTGCWAIEATYEDVHT